MPLSPLDIETRRFRRRLSGYDRNEVESFLASAGDALQQANLFAEQRARRVQELEEELEGFRERDRQLVQALSASERLSEERLDQARSEAERIIAAAREQAELLIARTQKELHTIRLQIAEAKAERDRFFNELRSLIDQHRRLLDLRAEEAAKDGGALRARSPAPPPHQEGEGA